MMVEPQMKDEEELQDVEQETDVAEPQGDENAVRISDLEKQLSEMKDRALREMAEAENIRKRAQKEREDTAKYAVANFAKEMLTVADNFRRALDAVPKEDTDPGLKNLMAGIEATERQLLAAFERFGIKKIEPLGQPFDPNFHQVMMEVDDPSQPAGTVVKVLQAGYIIHDRLLREAMVAVSKGGPASAHVDTSA